MEINLLQFQSVILPNYKRNSKKKIVLEKISYAINQWLVCVDLEMVNFLFDSYVGMLNIPVSYVYGIVTQKQNI